MALAVVGGLECVNGFEEQFHFIGTEPFSVGLHLRFLHFLCIVLQETGMSENSH